MPGRSFRSRFADALQTGGHALTVLGDLLAPNARPDPLPGAAIAPPPEHTGEPLPITVLPEGEAMLHRPPHTTAPEPAKAAPLAGSLEARRTGTNGTGSGGAGWVS